MNEDPKRKNRRTIIVENLDDGAVCITVVGPPYLATTSAGEIRNLSTLRIEEPGPDEEPTEEVLELMRFEEMLSFKVPHSPSIFGPEDRSSDEVYDPSEWHSDELSDRVGWAVLCALEYGVVADLRLWTQLDTLPGGLPRCGFKYLSEDHWRHYSAWARCTNKATTEVTELRFQGKVYDARLCDTCAERELKRPETQRK
jgi:hypothetical protein